MAVTLYCQTCGRGETVSGPGILPDCRICGPTTWRTATEPRVDYVVTHNDRRFLKSIRVAPDE